MLFNSYIFLIFLLFVLPLYYYLPAKYKNWLLLLSSYVFYGYWDWRFCLLLLASTVIDFYIGKVMHHTEAPAARKRLLLASLFANLGILGFFKYFNFFIGSFEEMLGGAGSNLDFLHLHIILPVGISFYTFQTLSYTIDIYRKKLKPTDSLLDFAVFVAFFPQLVAGPIERASNLLPQIQLRPNPTRDQIKKGVVLIIIGLFRKVMIGDTTGRIVDHIFTEPEYYASAELLMGLILFSIQIYADFSGYSHIARGTSKLLGIELMKNFEQPYLSTNITEFWRRWHISLSSWLRDYLYISLGGNRYGVSRTYINLMLTMLLGGLWHGASWTFVIWGGLHGIYLAVHKWMLKDKKIPDSYRYAGPKSFVIFLGKVFATYVLVLFTWLFFRVASFNDALYFLEKIVFWQNSELSMRVFEICFSFMALTLLFDFFEYYTKSHTYLLHLERYKLQPVATGVLTSMAIVVLIYIFQAEPLPFIYFQF